MSSATGEGTGSLEKALDVLDAIGAAPNGLSQNALAEHLSLPRATVYRLLATLVARGLVRRDPLRKVYCLGFRCFEMARQAYAMPDLVAAATLELRALRDLTGETTYLATLDGREVISLERCDGVHRLRSEAMLGQRKPVHCTSLGKAILSAMPDDARDTMVREAVLKPLTASTITDRRRLHAELRIARARGYAIDDEEIALGVRCVGAPVLSPSGHVRGAISVAGPAFRLTRARLELLGPEVAQAARRIGAQLLPDHKPAEGGGSTAVAVPGPWAFHGAHPIWSADGKRMWWADVLAPSIRLWSDGLDHELAVMEAPVIGLLRRIHSGVEELVVVSENYAQRLQANGDRTPVTPWLAQPVLAVCEGEGHAVWAAVALPESGAAIGLVRQDGKLDVHWRIGEAVQRLVWNPRDRSLYATAQQTGALLTLTPGHNVRRLASVPHGSGQVSGLAFDRDGGIWTALCDGWSLMRFTSDGHVDRVIGLPVPCPTDLAFVPDGSGQLVVTSARDTLTLDTLANAPLSGRLLVLAAMTP